MQARHLPGTEAAPGLAAGPVPELPPVDLPLEIGKDQLVEDAAHLDAEQRVFVAGVKVVGERDDPYAGVPEVVEDQQHESVVTGEARKVAHQNHVERVPLRSRTQSRQTRTIRIRAGHGLIGVDVVLEDNKVRLRRRMGAAGADLVLSRFRSLILAAGASVDRCTHGQSS